MTGIGPSWRSRAVQVLLGPDRSPLVPSTLWLGWLDAAGALIAMAGTSYPAASFQPLGDGVTNTAAIDGGVAGAGWAPIAFVGLFDAPGGSLIASAHLVDGAGASTTTSPAAGTALSLASGAVTFRAAA